MPERAGRDAASRALGRDAASRTLGHLQDPQRGSPAPEATGPELGSAIRVVTITSLEDEPSRVRVSDRAPETVAAPIVQPRQGSEEDPAPLSENRPSAVHSRSWTATLARIAGYRASVGDRVIVVGDDAALYVIAVVDAAVPLALPLPDGGAAELRGEALEIRDPAGKLRVRYAAGEAEITSPEGDLTLAAPNGRVVLKGGVDVTIEAARDVTHSAGRRLDLEAGRGQDGPQLRVEPHAVAVKADRLSTHARHGVFVAGQVTVIARAIETTAREIATSADRVELDAGRLIEKTRDVFRDVVDLAQTRAGRIRTIVKDVYTTHARRTVLVSEEDTSIDGAKVLLG